MPYIKKEDRVKYDSLLDIFPLIKSSGELNYVITSICHQYIADTNSDCAINYKSINDIIGALECAKLEFYRRHAAPYEKKKIAENSDLYIPFKE